MLNKKIVFAYGEVNNHFNLKIETIKNREKI